MYYSYIHTHIYVHIYIYTYIYIYMNIYIYINNLCNRWGVKLAKRKYRLASPGDFFRVEEFTDLLVFVNDVYNLKIWRNVNDVFEQFCCGCGYVPTANEKGMYTKILTENDSEGVLQSKSFPFNLEVVVTVR